MLSLKQITIEIKFAILLALSGLLLSVIIGLISGNDFGVVMFRAVLIMLVFGLLGAGAFFVIKKFVPEFYEAVSAGKTEAEVNVEDVNIPKEAIEQPETSQTDTVERPVDVGQEAERKFDPGLSEFDSSADAGKSSGFGKHILESKGFKFEPKLMAQAIRTMMKRDE